MEIYAKGQLSFLILNCLLERDFYGLDIISEIKERSNGNIDLKKPSVYSNLTRMEKQGQVSSYMRSSDVGPNRRYYSITEKGRVTYQELKDEFERNHFDVFKAFREDNSPIIFTEPINQNDYTFLYNQEVKNNVQENSNNVQDATILEKTETNLPTNHEDVENQSMFDNDFFDFSALETQNETSSASAQEDIVQDKTEAEAEQVLKLQAVLAEIKKRELEESLLKETSITEELSEEKISSNSPMLSENNDDKQQTTTSEQTYSLRDALIHKSQETKKQVQEENVDAVFLNKNDGYEIEKYNRRIYDISKDMNKYRKKRSFAEDQIAMTVEDPLQVSDERTKQKVEQFKNSLLENKNKYGRLSDEQFASIMKKETVKEETQTQKQDEIYDDGIFITGRVDEKDVAKARMIEPPRLKLENSTHSYVHTSSMKEQKLPAPKRDVNIDPSHKEIISRIYSKSRTSNVDEVPSDYLYDYEDLEGYYREQNISFKSYKKSNEKLNHNTNKLMLITSSITFVLMLIASAGIFTALYLTNNMNAVTAFLYLLLPFAYGIDVIVKAYNNAKYSSWEPSPMTPQWLIWLSTLVGIGAVVGLNYAFGFNVESFALFANTLILPISILLILLPVRYYTKRSLLIKYWR